ncbi:helix-turn-helix transcriptional regulator [Mesoterricola silvestris]|uniref:Transcriptional regulator n=1 Tax=Mesoterricola silvestris TaxID=2927979 RepID=A0AA48GK92_9BACT|nr:helix-turn-helix transcriptional regulator [Mesoterricola silvestris]BDU72882.1 transcriptional regulator [Mesoterricola silvestris]
MARFVVHNRVRESRQNHGLTQQDLADAVGVSRQSINSIEQGKYIPSLPLALHLARVFGLSTDALFELKER